MAYIPPYNYYPLFSTGSVYAPAIDTNLQNAPYPVSTIFSFNSPQVQRAANVVYNFKTAYDIDNNSAVTGKTYTFKTDAERMQYLMGSFALKPSSGSYSPPGGVYGPPR